MSKKKWRRRSRPQIPTPEQNMYIRKAGYDPYEWLVLWEGGETMRIMHRETRKTMIIEV